MAEWEVRPGSQPGLFDLTEDGKAALYDREPWEVERYVQDYADDDDRLVFDGLSVHNTTDLYRMMMR